MYSNFKINDQGLFHGKTVKCYKERFTENNVNICKPVIH